MGTLNVVSKFPRFPSTTFFAEGKKVKGWLGMMCFGAGIGWFMHFSSVSASVRRDPVRAANNTEYCTVIQSEKSCSNFHIFAD